MEPPFPSASHTTGVSYGNSRGGLPSGVPINSKASSFPRHLYDIFLLLVAENRQSPTLRWTTSGWWDQPVNHHWFPCGLPLWSNLAMETYHFTKGLRLKKLHRYRRLPRKPGLPSTQTSPFPRTHKAKITTLWAMCRNYHEHSWHQAFWRAQKPRWVETSFGEMRKVELRSDDMKIIKKNLVDIWENMKWDEKSSDKMSWGASVKCGVWGVKSAMWSVRKVFAWRCTAPGSRAGHVRGQQRCNSFAQSTHARALLAHGACKFSK